VNKKTLLIVAGVAVLALFWMKKSQAAGVSGRANKNSVPQGFVYDWTIDSYSRVRPDGSKEYLL